MNFIFMILFVLIILLLLCNYIKTLNKKVLALFILVLFIINELYFYFEKDKKDKNKEHYTGLDGESLPTLFSVSGLNPLANFPFTKSELEKSIKEENYISNNFDCEDHTIEGDCDADYGCIFNINKCQSKDDYCNKITDYTLCNDDAATNICIYKGDTCISQDRYCENLTSKQECSRANECEFNDSHQKCFSKKSKLSNGGVIQDHDTSGFDCHIYGSEEKCSQKQRILDKCTDDDPLPKCDNLDKTECGKKKGNGCNYNDTNQKCESNKYKICKNKYCIYDPNTQKKASSQTTQSLRDKFKCSVEDAFSMFKPTGAKTTGTGTGSGTCSPYTVFLKDFNKDNTVDSNGEPIPIPIPESNFVKAFNIENNKEIEQQRKLFKFSTSINPNKNNGTIMELLQQKKYIHYKV